MSLLIFPTQLFSNIAYIKTNAIDVVWLYEEPKFFTGYKYHKLKLLYHRVTCQQYFKWLKTKGIKCNYVDFNKPLNAKITHIVNPIDHELLAKYKKKYPKLMVIASQNFTLTPEEVHANAEKFYSAKTGRFSHELFYKWQRRRLNILVKKDGSPEGGKWSFDIENRKSFPMGEVPPPMPKPTTSAEIIKDATKYIQRHFEQNYGEMNLIYPTTHDAAKKWLKDFVTKRFKKFGKYEDASLAGEPFLYHSALTPMLNIGLLTDLDVIDEIIKHKNNVAITSFEGFLRQLIGWRNYMYCIYILRQEISQQNFFAGTRMLTDKWWKGTTGIDPIDDIIKNKIVKYSYTHHIERLMYLGSFMLMLGVRPDEVYLIFMEWTIDAYDWVMLPNVYGMSQFADGGKVMRRPYISSSNYILKMSNYKRGTWCEKWDALYYAFLWRHRKYFAKSYNYAVQVKNYIAKTTTEKQKINKIANELIADLTVR